jgi:phage terminase large subunit
MKSDMRELTSEQKEYARTVIQDPVLFASHVLGMDLWARESEILRTIKSHRRTAIKACHGVGKTFTLAVAALWWLARYPEGVVLTTSSTMRQVSTLVRRRPGRKLPGKRLSLHGRAERRQAISLNQKSWFAGIAGAMTWLRVSSNGGIADAASV